MRLIILGGSGAGKSTQAQRLCKYFEIPLVSTSEILRDANASLGDLGCFAHLYVDTGELVSDEMTIELIRQRLKKPDVNCGWVLEGYPRTVLQAQELDFLLDSMGQKLNWAIYLQVPQAVMVSRSVGSFLPDDLLEIVQPRIEVFYDCTIPILEYYDRRRRLLTINGDQFPEIVQQNILSLLSIPT